MFEDLNLNQKNSIFNIFYYLIVNILVVMIFNKIFNDPILNLTASVITFIGYIVVNHNKLLTDKNIFFDKKIFFELLFYIFLIYLINYSMVFILDKLFEFKIDPKNQETLKNYIKNGYAIPVFIFAVLCAPLIEELLFRYSIFSLIKNEKIALIISSLIFSFLHIAGEDFSSFKNILNVIPYLTAGLVFGYIYIIKNKNILFLVIIHFINNLLSFLLL